MCRHPREGLYRCQGFASSYFTGVSASVQCKLATMLARIRAVVINIVLGRRFFSASPGAQQGLQLRGEGDRGSAPRWRLAEHPPGVRQLRVDHVGGPVPELHQRVDVCGSAHRSNLPRFSALVLTRSRHPACLRDAGSPRQLTRATSPTPPRAHTRARSASDSVRERASAAMRSSLANQNALAPARHASRTCELGGVADGAVLREISRSCRPAPSSRVRS
jgi:hypothetical protein